MNKRFYPISSFLLIMAILLAPLANAAEPTLTVEADLDPAANAVTITGTISSGAGRQVSVVVTGPSGSVDYIDQTTSSSEGGYAFRYTLNENASGTYTVKVGGSGVSSPATATFATIDNTPPAAPANVTGTATRSTITLNWQASTDNVGVAGYEVEAWRGKKLLKTVLVSDTTFTDTGLKTNTVYSYQVRAKDEAGNRSAAAGIEVRTKRPGNSGGGRGAQQTEGQAEDDNPRTHAVDADSLKPAGQDSNLVTLIVPDGKDEVLLPPNAAEQLGSSSLTIQSGQMTVTIQPEVLTELWSLAGSEDLENAAISFLFVEGTQEDAEETLPSGRNGTAMRAAGQVMQFDLAMTTEDGVTRRLSAFSKPIEVVFSYDEDADANLIGVYYHNEETGEWEYIGGEIDEDNNRIVAELNHFSTYAVLEYNKTFADVPANYWASRTIQTLAAKHVINGVTDTQFAPHQAVNRAEFTALLVRALGLQGSAQSQPFKDVANSAWYAGDVAAAYEAGIVSGQSEDLFLPNANITREAMATMLVKAHAYAGGGLTTAQSPGYVDEDEIAVWAQPYVNRAAEAGLMIGSDNRFSPKAFATRAEAAQVIYNLLMH